MYLHPLCAIFPHMDDSAFESLKADIATNGLCQPIITLDGKILDGAHRYRACSELGIAPYLDEFVGEDPVAFVISANLHRRHMTPSQAAMVAASLANMKQGARTDLEPSASLPKVAEVSQADAARMLDVSTRSVTAAAKVIEHGTPELVEAVKQGEVSISKAAQIASLPKVEQAAAMAEPTPRPSRADEPAEQPDDAGVDNLLEDYEREVAENSQLRERLDALNKDDIKGELDRRILEVQGLRGRLNQEMATRAEAEKAAKRRGALLEEIRKQLGVERDSKILPALKGGAS
jgi:ParB-like chromosome segregation protein Spo0J